jgi:hypothetical protein
MAQGRYHERKLIEAVSYGFGALFIFLGTRWRADVSTLLLGMNVIITLGSLATGLRAARLGIAHVDPALVSRRDIGRMFADAFPYFVNNVSGLAIYGGFIALSALVLDATETARLSLLHVVLFTNLFQVFELLFRTIQTRMQDDAVMRRLRGLVLLAYLASGVVLAVAGPWLFEHVFRKYSYGPAELAVYATFIFLEIYYLLQTSRMQMRSSMRGTLQSMSLVKTFAFGLVLVAARALGERSSLLPYSLLLVAYSASMAFWIASRARGQSTLGQDGAGC